MNYKMIKHNFDKGLWTADMVRLAVRKGVITREQFKEITGQSY